MFFQSESHFHQLYPTTFDFRSVLWSLQSGVIKVRWARSASEADTPCARYNEPKHCLLTWVSSSKGETGWHGTASDTKYYPLWAKGLKLPAASGLLLTETLCTANIHLQHYISYCVFYYTMAKFKKAAL